MPLNSMALYDTRMTSLKEPGSRATSLEDPHGLGVEVMWSMMRSGFTKTVPAATPHFCEKDLKPGKGAAMAFFDMAYYEM